MKYLIFSDVHWSTHSSIVRSKGKKYSIRLEFLLKSMNWVNDLAMNKNCDGMICLGDFFDRSNCTDIELSALSEINWNNLPTIFIVGNHESSVVSLEFSTLRVFKGDNVEIISQPKLLAGQGYDFLFLPYMLENNRKSLTEYLNEFNLSKTKKLIILSHNELAGINYGQFTSTSGFNISEINANCDLYLNGHLHNNEWISSKILNVGSLSAHNFTNDSSRYNYGVWILDTDTMKLEFFENPYAFNFYKVDIESESDLSKLKNLKPNAVVSIKCSNTYKDALKETLEQVKNIVTYKIIYTRDLVSLESQNEITLDLGEDHLEQFKKYILDTLGNDDVVVEELSEVCK